MDLNAKIFPVAAFSPFARNADASCFLYASCEREEKRGVGGSAVRASDATTRRRSPARRVRGEGERRSRSIATHLGGRRHLAGEIQVRGRGVLLHEGIVGDVQIQRAAAGDEAVDLRRGREGGESRDETPRRGSSGASNRRISRTGVRRRAGDIGRATRSHDIRGRVRVRHEQTWVDTRSRNREGGRRTARMAFPGVTARFSSPRLNMLPSILLGAVGVSNESFESRSGGRGSRERCMHVCKAYKDRGYASVGRCARDLGFAGSRGFGETETCPIAFRISGSPKNRHKSRMGNWSEEIVHEKNGRQERKLQCAPRQCARTTRTRARQSTPRLVPCTRRRRALSRRTHRSHRGARPA